MVVVKLRNLCVLVLLQACASTHQEISERRGEQSEIPPKSLQGWWSDESACPEGATVRGSPPPLGQLVWCERAAGVWHGRRTEWFDSGARMSDLVYENGLGNGPEIYWHSNGRKHQEGFQQKGERHGPWKSWHANGVLESEGRFVAGQIDGIWSYWDDQGRLIKQEEFKEGTFVRSMGKDEGSANP
ncbi:MAG: hypothetical protein R3C68_09675 [Myxococcota bacterium]